MREKSTPATPPPSVSGVYPHLAVSNHGLECGIGAVAVWADRLWLVTYSPHEPRGSGDKLVEIDADLRRTTRPESVGGTPADRMIHRESNQLIIGPYFIDVHRHVRVVPPEAMPGRFAAVARHLTDPARKVLFYDMEGAIYEVDVHTLKVARLFFRPVAGWHGKGAWTGQGRFIISNNGEQPAFRFDPSKYLAGTEPGGPDDAGSLAEWDGRTWRIAYRRQFTEVAGPGDIEGARTDAEPVWALGWDRRSVLLALLDGGRWRLFRLPKASHTYDGRHGWYTEWPRIRGIGPDRRLATMHGTLWDFPGTFRRGRTAGIRPLSSYLKMIVDFCRFGDRVVFACNDASLFDNPLCGQAQSNLWFVDPAALGDLGPVRGVGGPWLHDDVPADVVSEPYLFAGYARRSLVLAHESKHDVALWIEVDADGTGAWCETERVVVPPNRCLFKAFAANAPGEWVRLRTETNARGLTAWFAYAGEDRRTSLPAAMFAALADPAERCPYSTGLIRPRGNDLGTLHFAAWTVDADGAAAEAGYYELTPDLKLRRVKDPETHDWLKRKAAISSPDFAVDAASVIVTDERGIRRRLPKGDPAFDAPGPIGWPRGIREVVTERSLFNAHGTLYELPRPSAGGMARLRPVCTHNRRIHDFCSWRGLVVLCGLRTGVGPSEHVVVSDDRRAALWLGAVDDLWKLGRPRGHGGPWLDTPVQAGAPSDPYLMNGFDFNRLELRHDANRPVRFTVEVDIAGDDQWTPAFEFSVKPGELFTFRFPDGFAVHWVRFRTDADCRATALLSRR